MSELSRAAAIARNSPKPFVTAVRADRIQALRSAQAAGRGYIDKSIDDTTHKEFFVFGETAMTDEFVI